MSNTIDEYWEQRGRSAWPYRIKQLLPVTEWKPLRIAFVYLIFGFLALFVSDVLFVRYLSEPLLSQVQALKGGVEVLLTAGLIFVLTNRREVQLQRTVSDLDRQHEELQVLHRVLRHNLRNDLNVIQGRANEISEKSSSARSDPHCTSIQNTVNKMIKYTEQASRIKQITTRGDRRVTHDLAETIPQLLENHPLLTSEVVVSTSLPDSAVVEVNPMFTEALDELLANAITHSDKEPPEITVTVDLEAGPRHMIELEIRDNGPGIPASQLEALQRGEEQQLLHLNGMGLWFVKWTVQHSRGEIRFETDEERGTTVRIRVPKAPEMLSSKLRTLLGL